MTAKIQWHKLSNESVCICVTWFYFFHLPQVQLGRHPLIFELDMSYNFLAIRRALNVPKRLLSFLWPARQAFERERERDFRAREGKGGEPFFFLPRTRAVVRPNRPFYRYGGHIELIWFKEYYRMPRGHEHISFVFSSAFRDIFS